MTTIWKLTLIVMWFVWLGRIIQWPDWRWTSCAAACVSILITAPTLSWTKMGWWRQEKIRSPMPSPSQNDPWPQGRYFWSRLKKTSQDGVATSGWAWHRKTHLPVLTSPSTPSLISSPSDQVGPTPSLKQPFQQASKKSRTGRKFWTSRNKIWSTTSDFLEWFIVSADVKSTHPASSQY